MNEWFNIAERTGNILKCKQSGKFPHLIAEDLTKLLMTIPLVQVVECSTVLWARPSVDMTSMFIHLKCELVETLLLSLMNDGECRTLMDDAKLVRLGTFPAAAVAEMFVATRKKILSVLFLSSSEDQIFAFDPIL